MSHHNITKGENQVVWCKHCFVVQIQGVEKTLAQNLLIASVVTQSHKFVPRTT